MLLGTIELGVLPLCSSRVDSHHGREPVCLNCRPVQLLPGDHRCLKVAHVSRPGSSYVVSHNNPVAQRCLSCFGYKTYELNMKKV